MSFLAELTAGDVRLGGKARSLAELAQAGFATPGGFVVTDALFRVLCPELPALARLDGEAMAMLDGWCQRIDHAPWPEGFEGELEGRLLAMRAERFAVRSSFSGEDRAGQLAAGVYESRLDLPAAAVGKAIREVLRSALSPGAVAYGLAHGQRPATGPVAVLVSAYVAGSAEGSAALVLGRESMLMVRRGQLPFEARQEIGDTLARLAAEHGAIEVEWVLDQGRVLYLQARPFQSMASAPVWAGWDELEGGEAAHAPWRWDASHNPLPLSPAQAGLVDLVDATCSIGVRQRVFGGYLFYAPDDRPLPSPIRSEDAEACFAGLRSGVEERLTAVGSSPALEDALSVFLFAYQPLFGVLQPALRRAHAELRAFLDAQAPGGVVLLPVLRLSVPSMASERLARAGEIAVARTAEARRQALAGYLGWFGDESATWDVSAPTYAEAPAALLARSRPAATPTADWRQASAEVEAMLAPGLREQWRALLRVARKAVGLGEDDDWLYARAQAVVRRALIALGRRLVAAGTLAEVEDVFYLPLPLLRRLDRGTEPLRGLGFMTAQARQVWQEALRDPPSSAVTVDHKAVRGTGTGGRAIGRVVWHRPGQPRSGRKGEVLVSRTLLPTELPLLDAIALVTETGGILDHVAAQARERGLPAVVGAQGALAALAEGDMVLVDADRGLVVKLE